MWLHIEAGPDEGQSVRIEGDRFTIGSEEGSGLRVQHADVEQLHATIRLRDDGGFELHDEGAAEGRVRGGRARHRAGRTERRREVERESC